MLFVLHTTNISLVLRKKCDIEHMTQMLSNEFENHSTLLTCPDTEDITVYIERFLICFAVLKRNVTFGKFAL